METTNAFSYPSNSLNQAIIAHTNERDNQKRKYIISDKYFVKVKDEKGKEYEIRYFF